MNYLSPPRISKVECMSKEDCYTPTIWFWFNGWLWKYQEYLTNKFLFYRFLSFPSVTHNAEIVVHKKCLPRMLSWMVLGDVSEFEYLLWEICGMLCIPMFGFSSVVAAAAINHQHLPWLVPKVIKMNYPQFPRHSSEGLPFGWVRIKRSAGDMTMKESVKRS